ncbi:uncharacterized protein PHALS_13295 [Plasmopara halstedii]|uniref:Uncharacterized protein n=1 Tax=Plasmopara halstedii TaxID=4781 RepID=A0A0N7L623_PLAHL|nr:uncharacterized protein PHALS_13295 [Plasmopara halstedii]CEG43075.1 hypothetical protein PHALS_13295 [Plasmopara halstedii]|eukprot:XP_024579444.1 hypothetical protein PHALS_13295 [Plasmopara halstedii]
MAASHLRFESELSLSENCGNGPKAVLPKWGLRLIAFIQLIRNLSASSDSGNSATYPLAH